MSLSISRTSAVRNPQPFDIFRNNCPVAILTCLSAALRGENCSDEKFQGIG